MTKPMSRKELEALVERAIEGHREGQHIDHDYLLHTAVTDAIWAEMVPTRAGHTDGAGDMQFANRCSGTRVRVLVLTDDSPAAEEPDGLKLARMVRKAWPQPRSYRLRYEGELSHIIAEADRIIEEAADAD